MIGRAVRLLGREAASSLVAHSMEQVGRAVGARIARRIDPAGTYGDSGSGAPAADEPQITIRRVP